MKPIVVRAELITHVASLKAVGESLFSAHPNKGSIVSYLADVFCRVIDSNRELVLNAAQDLCTNTTNEIKSLCEAVVADGLEKLIGDAEDPFETKIKDTAIKLCKSTTAQKFKSKFKAFCDGGFGAVATRIFADMNKQFPEFNISQTSSKDQQQYHDIYKNKYNSCINFT